MKWPTSSKSQFLPPYHLRCLVGGVMFASATGACGITVTGYTATINDRFASGFPTTPVANPSANFVGAGLDWTGVGWAASNPTKGFGFVSPSHYLVVRHYGGAPEITLALAAGPTSFAQAKVEDTGYGVIFKNSTVGDLSLGTLTKPVPSSAGLPRYGVLDLNDSSLTNSPNNYLNLPVLAYGRGPSGSDSPRVGAAIVSECDLDGYDSTLVTSRSSVQLEGGDSGSPTFSKWTNPNGTSELTLLGNNSGIDVVAGINGYSFVGTREVMATLNTLMNDDGRALRVVGNASQDWLGTTSAFANPAAWSAAAVPADVFVRFDAATSGSSQVVAVDSSQNLRGLYFKSSLAGNDGFAMGGAGTLTVGRGGITNYDGDRQTITAAIALGSSQYWDGGSGGITVGAINTQGYLLESAAIGINRIDGTISGSGGIALSHGTLVLSATNNSYTGKTWVHGGQLIVTGNTPVGSEVTVGSGGTLQGSGLIGGATTIQSGGTISPGNSPGTLTIDANVTWQAGANYNWQISNASGMAGTHWDLLDIDGNLDLTAISAANPFRLNLWSLAGTSPDLNGEVAGFDPALDWNWPIVTASGAINGFSADKFSIQVAATNGTGGFANNLSGGVFSLVLDGSQLSLAFNASPIPEPASALATACWLASGLWLRRRAKRGA